MGTVGHPSTGLVGSFCVDNEEGNGPKHGFRTVVWYLGQCLAYHDLSQFYHLLAMENLTTFLLSEMGRESQLSHEAFPNTSRTVYNMVST